MGWLEIVILLAVALWLMATALCLWKGKDKGCNGCCDNCNRNCK